MAVRIAHPVTPHKKLRPGDFMNRQVGTIPRRANANARARLRSPANGSRHGTRFAKSSQARPIPEKQTPRKMPTLNAGFRTLRAGNALVLLFAFALLRPAIPTGTVIATALSP